jgi:hypothetical protein
MNRLDPPVARRIVRELEAIAADAVAALPAAEEIGA